MGRSERLGGVTIQKLEESRPRERLPPDADAFEEFVHATGDRIHRAALLLCGDHHLAEDLTQTTFAKVYAAWPTVAAADSPLAYTRTVLMRTFLSHRRLRRSAERPVDRFPEAAAEGPDLGTPARPARRLAPPAAARPGGAGAALLGGPVRRADRRAARRPRDHLPDPCRSGADPAPHPAARPDRTEDLP